MTSIFVFLLRSLKCFQSIYIDIRCFAADSILFKDKRYVEPNYLQKAKKANQGFRKNFLASLPITLILKYHAIYNLLNS